jgi:hypothetical protein
MVKNAIKCAKDLITHMQAFQKWQREQVKIEKSDMNGMPSDFYFLKVLDISTTVIPSRQPTKHTPISFPFNIHATHHPDSEWSRPVLVLISQIPSSDGKYINDLKCIIFGSESDSTSSKAMSVAASDNNPLLPPSPNLLTLNFADSFLCWTEQMSSFADNYALSLNMQASLLLTLDSTTI